MCSACEKQKFKIAAHTHRILKFVSRHLVFLTQLALDNIESSVTEFLDIENLCITVEIMQLRCMQAKL